MYFFLICFSRINIDLNYLRNKGSTLNQLNLNVNINKCIFEDIFTNSNGGAIFFNNLNYNFNIINSFFKNCTAYSIGGGLYIKGENVIIQNSCFDSMWYNKLCRFSLGTCWMY